MPAPLLWKEDAHVNLMELGAAGEFVGAIGVVASLVYLSVQIRQNTRSMDEGRTQALAQTYQMRADALQDMLVRAADSDHLAPIIIKLTEAGYPEDTTALDQLGIEERAVADASQPLAGTGP